LNLERKKSIINLFIFASLAVLFMLQVRLVDPKKQVVFLDVKGDSTFIKDSFDQCNILIDTGEVDEYNTVINYLHSRNIERIDYLIVSHYHSDHYGEVNDITKEFSVDTIITKETVDNYDSTFISCGTLSFFIYDLSYDDENENNNSIVLSLYVEDKHYLFVGDSEIEREEEFLNLYKIDVDYLKVGHHGSTTSTSQSFLDVIQPEGSFIMVHRDNRNNHPNSDVIERLIQNEIEIYRTDILGTIEVSYLFGNETKKYYSP